MSQFKTLRGRRILIEVPKKKESVITLSEKDKDALMYEEMKAWNRLTIYAVGDKVEDVKAGDVVYIAVSQLEHAEKVDIDGSVKLMLNEMDIAIIWELSSEDVKERIKTYSAYNPYNVKDLKYIDLSDPVHDFRKDIPPFNSRPEYYGGKDSAYEVFTVLEAWKLDKDFYLGNVLKYLARSGKKSFNKKEDLEKALVYLQRRIDTL